MRASVSVDTRKAKEEPRAVFDLVAKNETVSTAIVVMAVTTFVKMTVKSLNTASNVQGILRRIMMFRRNKGEESMPSQLAEAEEAAHAFIKRRNSFANPSIINGMTAFNASSRLDELLSEVNELEEEAASLSARRDQLAEDTAAAQKSSSSREAQCSGCGPPEHQGVCERRDVADIPHGVCQFQDVRPVGRWHQLVQALQQGAGRSNGARRRAVPSPDPLDLRLRREQGGERSVLKTLCSVHALLMLCLAGQGLETNFKH